MPTLYSSFNAGISGLNANSNRLAAIADNISNTGTQGYKRVVTSFHSVVLGGAISGPHTAGGVRASTMRLIDERGALTSTANATDLAVTGRGFLPVTSFSAIQRGTGAPPLMLATTGSFRPDADGLLRNPADLVLLGWPANSDGTIGTFPRDTATGLQPIRLRSNQFASEPTTDVRLRLNLPANATRAGGTGNAYDLSVDFYSALGGTEAVNLRFSPNVPTAGASNEWTIHLTDPRNGDALVGEYVLAFDTASPNAGRILSVTGTPSNPGGAFDPATGRFTVQLDNRTISIDIGRPGSADGLTQMASSFAPVSIDRNGAPVQTLLGVQVEQDGLVRAFYDSGMVRVIAQIPLVDVPNPNGLIALDNQVYRVSANSGPMFLWNAGEGPTGSIQGFAREESATDVANELTNMIQTQRAYSSNAKVIQTVDEMLQETTNIKR